MQSQDVAPSSSAAIPKRPKHILSLDVLRIAAALLVVSYHYCVAYWLDGYGVNYVWHSGHPNAHLFNSGWVGVEIFFVISGFVIAYSAVGVSASTFVQHRASRLVPAMLICATLAIPLRYLGAGTWDGIIPIFERWARSIFFDPTFPYIDDSHWTLAVEVEFYGIVFALLLFNKIRWLQATLIALGIASTALCATNFFALVHPTMLGTYLSNRSALVLSTGMEELLVYGCFFAIGVLLQICLTRGFDTPRLVMVAIFTVSGVMEIVVHAKEIYAAGGPHSSATIATVLWFAGLLAVLSSEKVNERLTAWSGPNGARVFRRLGLMTYPLYLIHQSLGRFTIIHLHPHANDGITVVVALIVTLIFSYLMSAFVEPPASRLIRRLLQA
jgi:peptidoglycan/LPS O-acetylase OafA/YrhL